MTNGDCAIETADIIKTFFPKPKNDSPFSDRERGRDNNVNYKRLVRMILMWTNRVFGKQKYNILL